MIKYITKCNWRLFCYCLHLGDNNRNARRVTGYSVNVLYIVEFMEKTIIYFNSFPFKSALIKIKTNLNFLFCEILACEMHCATISM